MPSTRKPRNTDEDRKEAFLDAARITDTMPYQGLNTEDTINAVRSAAGLTYEKIGPTRQAADSLVRNAVNSKFTKSATTLGKKLAPLLDEVAQGGRIDRASGVFQTEWADRRKMQPDMKEAFCNIIGVDPSRYAEMTLSTLIRHWRRNAGLTYNELSSGEADKFQSHVGRGMPLEKEEVEQAAYAVAVKLNQGISEGWIDPESKEPLAIERILKNKLGNYIVVRATGTEALIQCMEQVRGLTGLPSYAIAQKAGRREKWLAPSLAVHIPLSGVAQIADIVLPYLTRQQRWNATEEFVPPERLPEQTIARDHFISKVREYLPEVQREVAEAKINAVLNPMPQTLGETMKKLREAAAITQKRFGDALPQSEISRIERNANSISIAEEDGRIQLKGALRGQLDTIARMIAQNIGLERHPLTRNPVRPAPLLADLKKGPFAQWMQDRIRLSVGETPEYLAEQWNKNGIAFQAAEIAAMSDGTLVPTNDQLKTLASRLYLLKSVYSARAV